MQYLIYLSILNEYSPPGPLLMLSLLSLFSVYFLRVLYFA